MKKLILLPLLCFSILSFAQPTIVLQNITTRVFSNINDAINAANSGDTLYVPGGGFSVSATVDKTLHWIGVGHYPDSTLATGQSKIVSAVSFTGNCDNSTFEGIDFTSTFSIGSADNELENIIMKRCRVRGTLYLRTSTTGTPNINAQISECVLYSIDGNNASNCLVEKCNIFYMVNNFHQSLFKFNNMNLDNPTGWYGSNTNTVNGCINCQFRNNIFSNEYELSGVESCEFSYNLYAGGLPFDPVNSTNSGTSNLINVGADNIYDTITTTIIDFQYNNDYHLKEGCPGIGAADDGTNIGIYGSPFPYKEGAVPSYPHIRAANINTIAVDGKLGVKIGVAAQER